MNITEIGNQLQDIQDLLSELNRGMKTQEEKEIKFPEQRNYDDHFDDIKKLFGGTVQPLQEVIAQQVTTAGKLLSTVREATQHNDGLIKGLPKDLKMIVNHKIEGLKPHWYIYGGVVVFLTLATSIAFCYGFWNEKQRLEVNDIKYRMMLQKNPIASSRIDSTYYSDPKKAKLIVDEQEAKARAVAQAELAAKRKEEEAKQAKEQLKKVKDGK